MPARLVQVTLVNSSSYLIVWQDDIARVVFGRSLGIRRI
jgi:hypothetical protein